MTIKGWWEDPVQAHSERCVPTIFPGAQEKKWISLHADQEYVLQVNLLRTRAGYRKVQSQSSSLVRHTFYPNVFY